MQPPSKEVPPQVDFHFLYFTVSVKMLKFIFF